MKRRVLSLIIALALCLNLCPMWAFAADNGTGGGLCPHHPAHTDECGYREPTLEQACTHIHDDGCYITETDCIHQHTAECYLNPDYDPETDEPDACAHVCTEDGGCVARTLSCLHEHDDTCGYAPADPGAACTFVCRICPIDDLIGKLPAGASAYNSEQVQAQLIEIYALYDRLSYDEQQQVDLSRCAALQEQIDAMGIAAVSDVFPDIPDSVQRNTLTKDTVRSSPFEVARPMRYDTDGYTLSCPNASAMQVTGAGQLYLTGTVTSGKGAGVEVQSGGFLSVRGEATAITGKTYALDIASGATVQLAAGTYTGGSAAIRMAGGDFADLLAPGYAFFDGSGNPILSADAAAAKTLVVKQCTDHANKTYVTNTGAITHTWTCQVCKAEGTEPCTFTFDENGKGTCALCGNEVTVMVNRDSLKELAYDTSNSGNVQPANGTVTVTAKNGTPLTQGADYTVGYSVHADVGNTSVTVTVTVVMGDNKGTFTKGYTFTKDELTRPVLEWDTVAKPVPVTLPYDGDPVEASELPPVTINIKSDVDLHQYLQYSYKAQGDSAYTDGLPTNAGTYDVVVSLPEKPVDVPDYEAASSEPITLIINKISPILTPPAAIELTFDRTEQTLVTAGALHSAAARDGVVIKFAIGQNGAYSTAIPTGINAGEYDVWYQTEETENFLAVGPLKISGVEIQRKPVTPIVTLSEYTYLYTGGYHQPDVEVRDEDNVTVLLDSEYAVEYVNNRNVSTDANPAKVVVTDKSGGNYAITKVEVQFKITLREQETLSITNKPDTVAYGDEFTLSTLGGSGNGNVTWEVVTDTGNDGSATINATSGRVKITGAGTITVKATKSGVDPGTNIRNYDDATAIWTFTADKKPVVATVTAEDKDYNGDNIAIIHAVVEEGVLPGDEITITGLTGTFSDANAGVDKPVKVTVDPSKVTIQGANSQHYDVSYSSLTVTATIRKAVAKITTPPEAAELTYDGNAQKLIDARNLLVDPSGIQVEYAMSKDGPYSTDIPERTNAGTYTVWYRVQETPNYTGLEPESIDVEIKKKPVTPAITLSGDGLDTDNTVSPPMQYYIYDGTAKEPAVTLEDENGDPIPADEYTVGYSKNINVGTATVTIKAKDEGNYSFNVQTKNFRIDKEKARVVTAPKMAGDPLTYNTRAQQLVTEGTGSGGTMVYALEAADGTKTFSETIPSATNAADYTVYYKVKGDDNHSDSDEGQVIVTIAPKTISPVIDPAESSYLYDGAKHEPKITVKDGKTVIDEDQYTITWANDDTTITDDILTAAGSYTATITNVSGGNYLFTAKATVEIVPASQAALNITGQPEHVYYGDKITTLSTSGGSGNGTLTWSITSSVTNSTINSTTGELIVKDTGSITVKAERAVPNYGTVSDTWTFTVEPKPVMAEVTVTGKVYDGSNSVADGDIKAEVKESDLVNTGDSVTISGLTGTYDNANVGTNKTVTLNDANIEITTDPDKYTVVYPATAKADITARPVDVTVTLSGNDLQPDNSGATPVYSYEYDGTEKTPTVTVTGTDAGGYSAMLAASDYTFSYANNKNVGTASVTVKCAEGGNYDFGDETVYFAIESTAAKLTSTPQAKRLTYNGTLQDLVTVGTATGGTVVYSLSPIDPDDKKTYSEDIPQGEDAGVYTVYYMVKGDDNHEDTGAGQMSVTIDPKEITPKITLNQDSYVYSGSECKPTVTVEDGNTEIGTTDSTTGENSEYSVSYRDNINAGMATVIVSNKNGGNYIVNGTSAFTIGKADLTAADITDPEGLENLPYNGAAQALIKAGNATGGTMVYSLEEEGEYSAAVPTATAVGPYTVYYKVQGDGNHNDTEPVSVDASIIVNTVNNPTIQVEPEKVNYTGEKQAPAITVKDENGVVINGSEYEVTYTDADGDPVTDLTNAGKYTVTITGVQGGNYTFDTTDGKNTADFEILLADQEALTITGTREQVYYGDKIQLGSTGGNGTVSWKVDDGSTVATIDGNGLLKITGVGSVTVTATSEAFGYTDQTATWRLYADQKPVTAVVTAASKEYDGETDTTVTATLQASDLVNGDDIKITLSGEFEDPSAGTDKKVIVDSTSPDFTGSTGDPENYKITYPATTTASILKADIEAKDVTAPAAADAADLVYTGTPLALVEAGAVTGGTMEYSTDGINFSASLPTGTNAGDYDVWYRVKGDGNHNDTTGTKLDDKVIITKQTVTNPTIEFTPNSVSYDGAVHKPTVTVKDSNGRIIPDTEYTVTYGDTDWKTAGAHAVTITGNEGGNYDITTKSENFTILPMGQSPLSILNQPGRVQYGDTFTLVAVGGSGTGAVTWESSNSTIATVDANSGLVTVKAAGGPVTITATRATDGNYGAATATWTFSAEKKAVTPIVTADDKVYDGKTNAEIHVTWKDGDLVGNDTISANHLTAAFASADVGTNKVVNITGTLSHSNYVITLPTVRASITPKTASVSGSTPTELTYTGTELALVSGVTATDGTMAYSRDGSYYTLNVPKETNAGTYTVWYKAQADAGGNFKDSPAVRVDVTIKPKTVADPVIDLDPDTFEYDGTAKKPDVTVKDGSNIIPASEYTVSYSNNTAVGTTAKVTISDAPGGNYMVSGTKTFTITAGAAKLTGAPQAKNLTYNGNPQELVTDGTAVNGEVVYSLTGNDDYTPAIPTGINAGTYCVYYKVEGANGAADTAARVVYVTIQPKSVTPTVIVTQSTVSYDGTAKTPQVFVTANNTMLTQGKDYNIFYSNNTNPGTAMVLIWSIDGSNYQFSTTTTFEIVKEAAKFTANPTGKALSYDGTAQELVNAGTVEGGTAFYSLDGVTYSGVIPTGTETKQYTVFAKVVGDSTHADSDPVTITAEIKANKPEHPRVVLSDTKFSYTGGEIKPTVTVYDDSNKVIPATEYTVSYSNNTNVGTATVTVTSSGKNYSFTATAKFEIVNAGQPQLEITGKKDAVYYGDTLSLGATGGTGSSVVSWTVSGPADKLSDGQFKITGSGMVTITATKAASTGYEEVSDTWTFFASPKPVEAVVTAADKDYDGKTDATLNVAVTGLVNGDTIPDDGIKAEGKFTDERVGADKTVIVTLTISDGVREKYDISYPATIKASITQAPPEVTAPTLAPGLTYNGAEQALLTNGGTATGGNIMYSLDGGSTYSFNIPTAKDAGNYTIWYKAVASDENHKDTAPALAGTVTIAQNTEKPSNATCSPNTVQYSGAAQTPAVDVLDSTGRPIPAEEYTVTVVDGPAINPGTYTASIKDNPGGNYEFSDTLTADFEIVAVSQNPLTITDKPVDVHYGDKFSLSAVGGSGSGKIVWSIAGDSSIAKIENGVVTVTGTGAFTVEAYREAWGGYGKSNTDSVSFYADPKPITPVVTAANKRYDGTTTATLTAKFKNGDLVGDDEIELIVGGGTFETENVGANTVLITPGSPNGACGNYYITWPESTTASISRVKAEWDQEPEGADLTYTGDPLPLLTAGATLNGIGKVEYSASQYGRYSEEIPVGINADTYTVWYRVADDVNYQGIAATSITVEIKQEKPRIDTKPSASGTVGQKLSDIQFSDGGAASVNGKFAWKDGTIEPPLGQSQQEVIFTPDDTANYETVTFQITVTITNPSGDTPGDTGTTTPSVTPSEPNTVQTTVQNGTASAVVSTAAGARLVKEAVENQSQNIVIKPEITGDVTKTEVSIPASTVSQIKSQTNAALTVSAPIADVTIPNEALDTLSRAGGTVNVVTEQAEQAVVLTVTAGGKTVDSVPGGLTLTVPAEDAGPGTVAVLVHEDGTRETVQKSVVEDGKISVPLSGSATVEIVDNSKEFTDVSPTSWEADAVAFASAHELFSGTSETTFSPNESMSRGMLATVLYRLEGCPDQEGATTYGDVSSDAWYADGVAWVTENGIANGYGDGQFGPNDNITREQFAVMLWNYAGRPAASSQVLDFTDADQAGSYALEALCWAAENGILNGYSNGQLVPGGTATRAQAAQMLKNFMENT